MRANQRAASALDAVFGDPGRNVDRDAALLITGRTGRDRAVRIHLRNGQLVALLLEDRLDVLEEVRIVGDRDGLCAFGGGCPGFRIVDLFDRVHAGVDRGIVLRDDRVALLGVGLLCRSLHVFKRLIRRDDVREFEERGLHDRVDAAAHADFARELDCIDVVELEMVLCDRVLHGRGQLLLHFFKGPRRVQKERAAFLDAFRNRVAGDVRRVVACRKVRLVDEVRALDRGLAEAQMGYRETAGLLGVVGEVALRVHVGVVADDLDAVLVRADRTVGTETEELAGDRAFRRGVHERTHREAGERDVVDDTDREVILGLVLIEVIIDSLDHRGREFLAAETVASADDLDAAATRFTERGHDVLIQRFAEGAGLLGAVEDCDLLAGCRDRFEELVCRERTVQTDLDETELLALAVQVVDRLFRNVCAAAHDDENFLRIGCADIVEEVIVTARDLADLVHIMLNDLGDLGVVIVRCFTVLEIDVRVLRRTAEVRMIRVHCARTERCDRIAIEELIHVCIVDELDLLDFMRRTEAIEEMAERNGRLDCGKMRDQRKVHDFLYGSGCEERKARLTARHYVAVIAEDGECMCCERTGGYVEYAGEQLAADFVHVGDHKEQALRRRKGRRERACFEGAVHSACSACFGLHLCDANLLSEQVQTSVCRPLVSDFRHRRGRSDRINCGNIGKCIRDMRSSGITVDRHGFCHSVSSYYFWGFPLFYQSAL